MATDRQMRANRKNSEKSTGPKTRDGKRRASRNATKWGLLAQDSVIFGEKREAYEAFRDDMWDTWNPLGAAEEYYVDRLVADGWRLARGGRIETAILINGARRRSNSFAPVTRRRQVSRVSQLISGHVQPGEPDDQDDDLPTPSEREIEEAPLHELAEVFTGGAADELRKLDRHETAIHRRYQANLNDLMALQKKRLG